MGKITDQAAGRKSLEWEGIEGINIDGPKQ